jgi:hypothetical protein
MALGQVISMKYWRFNQSNQGMVLDFASGNQYPFRRPAVDVGTIPRPWDVKVHDIIEYTLVDGVAEEVVLYKKHTKGMVYYKPI